jgi:hypothetical protein
MVAHNRPSVVSAMTSLHRFTVKLISDRLSRIGIFVMWARSPRCLIRTPESRDD